ncbi:MAG: hypothetical protein C5B50_02960 [Verrucomicrobia bacterium]|nr:MAG: hypothetical protein C5B50_02960 [Verrucomicrobiota bacterium]
MKAKSQFINALAVGSAVLAMVSTLAAQTPSQGAATVVRMRGNARYTTAPNNWKPLSVGDVLKPGTIVQTDMGHDSYVDLVLGDGRTPLANAKPFNPSLLAAASGGATGPGYKPAASQNVVRVADNTVLGVDKLTSLETGADVVTDTQLDLKAGHIFGNVKKMSKESRYEIKLPNGVAGIRGTSYEIWWNGKGKVSAGSMLVTLINKAGVPETNVLEPNTQLDPDTGKITPLPASDPLFKTSHELSLAMGQSPPSINTAVDITTTPVSTHHHHHHHDGDGEGP